jgi:hypothetical protein
VFRLESITDALKRNYIPSSAVDEIAKDPSANLSDSQDQIIETPEEVPAAYPQVQPMKAALYFDNAEGFGQWRILISGRADRNLRKTRKKDTNLFRITLKKIKYPFVFVFLSSCVVLREITVENCQMAISPMTTKSV